MIISFFYLKLLSKQTCINCSSVHNYDYKWQRFSTFLWSCALQFIEKKIFCNSIQFHLFQSAYLWPAFHVGSLNTFFRRGNFFHLSWARKFSYFITWIKLCERVSKLNLITGNSIRKDSGSKCCGTIYDHLRYSEVSFFNPNSHGRFFFLMLAIFFLFQQNTFFHFIRFFSLFRFFAVGVFAHISWWHFALSFWREIRLFVPSSSFVLL